MGQSLWKLLQIELSFQLPGQMFHNLALCVFHFSVNVWWFFSKFTFWWSLFLIFSDGICCKKYWLCIMRGNSDENSEGMFLSQVLEHIFYFISFQNKACSVLFTYLFQSFICAVNVCTDWFVLFALHWIFSRS